MIQTTFNYKNETNRFRYYYHRLHSFYDAPITQVSSAVLFTLLLIIFFGMFALRPTLQTVAELLKKIEDQKQVLAQANKKSAALASAQIQYQQVTSLLPALTAAIPADYALQPTLLSLEAVAGELGIPLSNLKVDEVKYPLKPVKKGYNTITLSLTLTAPYATIKAFIQSIEKLPRLMVVDAVSLSQNKIVSGTPTNSNEIAATLTCRVFTYPQEKP